jgi:hypothetical protein
MIVAMQAILAALLLLQSNASAVQGHDSSGVRSLPAGEIVYLPSSVPGEPDGSRVPPRPQAPQLTPTTPDAERRDQPVTQDDVRILQKANELLKDESVWNRADDRDCKDDEATGKRSLFCALQKACIDVLGVYDHRRVALQEVRFAVEDATKGQEFEHRLRDFNNLPTTTLSDIKEVLRVATERVQARLAGK